MYCLLIHKFLWSPPSCPIWHFWPKSFNTLCITMLVHLLWLHIKTGSDCLSHSWSCHPSRGWSHPQPHLSVTKLIAAFKQVCPSFLSSWHSFIRRPDNRHFSPAASTSIRKLPGVGDVKMAAELDDILFCSIIKLPFHAESLTHLSGMQPFFCYQEDLA